MISICPTTQLSSVYLFYPKKIASLYLEPEFVMLGPLSPSNALESRVLSHINLHILKP